MFRDAPVAPARGPGPVSAVFVVLALALLVGLGLWQLQRLKWKEALLAHVAALQSAPAEPLETVLRQPDQDFRRVSFVCPDALWRPSVSLYGVQGGAIGRRVMTACPVSAGPVRSVLVDLGFQPDGCLDKPPAPWTGPIIGILRAPDPKSFVTPPAEPARRLWYWRDLPAMAKALGAASPAADFVAVERGPSLDGCLIRQPIPLNIPNRHLEYALTWFGLAASLVGVYVARLWSSRPKRSS
jgi:surfeit locus 1 family protein